MQYYTIIYFVIKVRQLGYNLALHFLALSPLHVNPPHSCLHNERTCFHKLYLLMLIFKNYLFDFTKFLLNFVVKNSSIFSCTTCVNRNYDLYMYQASLSRHSVTRQQQERNDKNKYLFHKLTVEIINLQCRFK